MANLLRFCRNCAKMPLLKRSERLVSPVLCMKHIQSDSFDKLDRLAERSSLLKKIEEEMGLSSSSMQIKWQDVDTQETVEPDDEFAGISLNRGLTGIFDLEELVDILKREKLFDVVVISVPKELHYVDHMVIVTARSPKQMVAAAEFIRKIAKHKRGPNDSLPVIEGQESKDWIAIDLGNIVLHMFSSKYRKMYDLETLWTVGVKYDDLSRVVENPVEKLLSG